MSLAEASETVADIKTHWADRRWAVRLFEILPGAITWTFILGPILLSLAQPILVAYFIIAFDLAWLIKTTRLSFNLIRGYRCLYDSQAVDWESRLRQLNDLPEALAAAEQKLKQLLLECPRCPRRWQWSQSARRARRQYLRLASELERIQELLQRENAIMAPEELLNVVILATYKESLEILEPSLEALTKVNYPLDQLIFVLAYEERGGEATEANAQHLIKKYGHRFKYAMAVKHPDCIPGEARGKGANISYAGRELTRYIEAQQIDPEKVIVTTFDSDHRPGKNYFAYLSYAYATDVNRVRKSFQPIPMFYNNIWDVPAPMRVIATGNSFWMIMEAMRPRRMRNFAAHAQSLKALIETDYWSVTSIVEDGHQYWRTYFTFDGDHQVVPLFTPVFQDAVLAKGYIRTFKVQYLQLQRWAWGVSDLSYVIRNAIQNPRIALANKIVQTWRLFEGHFSWATAPLILTFVAWLPLFLNQDFADQKIAHDLPLIASRILTATTIGLVVTVLISLLSLPPKPAHHRRTRLVGMVAQWALLPVTAILFSAFAAIDSQTRLMFGRYLDFRVTEKATKRVP